MLRGKISLFLIGLILISISLNSYSTNTDQNKPSAKIYLKKYADQDNNRLLINEQFGHAKLVPMIIDTGSPGAVVNCSAVFGDRWYKVMGKKVNGATLCDLLTQGDFPYVLNIHKAGIRILHKPLQRVYGAGVGKPHIDKGYLAYAVLTLNDAHDHRIKTHEMPFFLAYQYNCHADACGTLGMNSGNLAPKKIISPIYYMKFAKGTQAGFILHTGSFAASDKKDRAYIIFGVNSKSMRNFRYTQLIQEGNAPNGLSFWVPFVVSAIKLQTKTITKTFFPVKTLIDSGASILLSAPTWLII